MVKFFSLSESKEKYFKKCKVSKFPIQCYYEREFLKTRNAVSKNVEAIFCSQLKQVYTDWCLGVNKELF